MNNDIIIRFEHISKTYGENVVLQDFNLDIRRGEFLTVIGSSGSGKTTGSGKATGSSDSASGSSGSASGGSRSAVSAGVPYTAALLRSQGKSDVAITSALRQEGYTPAQIAKILQEMNK